MKRRTYVIECKRTGKEWKTLYSEFNHLEDNTLYRGKWKTEGLFNLLRALWIIKTKEHGKIKFGKES